MKLNIGTISYRFEILNHYTNGAVPKDQWFQNEQYYLGHLCLFSISDIVYNNILLKFNPKCTHFTKKHNDTQKQYDGNNSLSQPYHPTFSHTFTSKHIFTPAI